MVLVRGQTIAVFLLEGQDGTARSTTIHLLVGDADGIQGHIAAHLLDGAAEAESVPLKVA